MASNKASVKASGQSQRSAMTIDPDRCIGCWGCAIACKMKNNLKPGVWWLRIDTVGGEGLDVSGGTFPNPQKAYRPVIERCAFTESKAANGDLPDCLVACPVGVFQFGDLDDTKSTVSQQVQNGGAVQDGTPRGADYAVYYLPARKQARQRRSGYLGP